MTLTKVRHVEIDVCEDHGVWLDRGELEAIVRRVESHEALRGRARAREESKRASYRGKVSGWLLGPLAFLFE
jgi:Zn-finger nucleic acid-binding protein